MQHLQTEIETLRSGGGLESMVKEGNSTEVALLKREMLRLTDELVRSDAGTSCLKHRSLVRDIPVKRF